jgi:thymidylate synthase
MHVIVERTADQIWHAAATLLLDPQKASWQASRAGDTVETLHVLIELQRPSQRWISVRSPAMNPAFALVETFWIVSGRHDSHLPTYWNPALPRYCGSGENYHGAYGHRIRRHLGIDQLDRVYSALRNNPDSRQCVLQIWDSTVDLPALDGAPANQDIPCSLIGIPKVRNGKLEWMQIIRSNDLFLGLPHNIVQFTMLQEMLAGWLGVQAGSYHQLSDSLHIYAKDIDRVKQSIETNPGPVNADSFAIDRQMWDDVLPIMMSRLERLSQESLSLTDLKSIVLQRDLPTAYFNALAVCAADSARRRGWEDGVQACILQCTNPALVHLWSRWDLRCRAKQRPASDAVSSQIII